MSPVAEITASTLAELLASTAPFSALTADARTEIAAAATVHRLPGASTILVEDGPPASALWLVLAGSVELLHDGEVILVLEPGQCFGHPSLLTGMAPAYTVRTREPVELAEIGRAQALAALGTTAGAAFVAASLRTRLVRQGHVARAGSEVGTTPVSAIMARPAFISAGASLRAAVELLREHRAVIVGDAGDPAAIITDATVREAFAADQLQLDAPVGLLGDSNVVQIPVGQLAVEAAVDMLAAGVDSAAVVDPGRDAVVVGTLSAGDLVGLDVRSPIALRHTILGAADENGLVRSAAHLPQLFVLLQRAGVPPRDLGRVLSLQHDALAARLIDFSISRHGAPASVIGENVAWAWLDMGSAARREFTLGSDQDNALAYAAPPTGLEPRTDAYFARMGEEVNAGLIRCGFGADHNGVLASKPLWRMSKAAWLATFEECFRIPDESHLIRASVAFDFRSAAGGLAITAELAARVRAAREHPDFMRLMARAASGFGVALGRRNHLVTGHFDEPAGRLDIKRGAIIPLVNLVRFHALAAGVTISPTLDRIAAAAATGSLSADTAAALREAFDVITRVRLQHHADQIQSGLALDNLIDPGALSSLTRGLLEDAMAEVRRAQRQIEVLGGTR